MIAAKSTTLQSSDPSGRSYKSLNSKSLKFRVSSQPQIEATVLDILARLKWQRSDISRTANGTDSKSFAYKARDILRRELEIGYAYGSQGKASILGITPDLLALPFLSLPAGSIVRRRR